MKKVLATVTVVALSATLAQAGMYLNVGNSAAAGEGPTGADANYLDYDTPNETATSGQVTTYNGVSFAEGGLGGTYDVGVGFTWLDASTDATKQAFGRSNNQGYADFFSDWVGIDTRDTSGGIGGGDRLMLSLTGLAANQDYTFTSYHFDTQNQAGTFTVDQNLAGTADQTTVFDFPRSENVDPAGVAAQTPWIDNAYSFDVTSDGSGNLDITYTQASGSWIGVNGFDLVAVPEPGTLGLVAVFGGGVLFIRRRFKI